jgi:lia operon protein LiaG
MDEMVVANGCEEGCFQVNRLEKRKWVGLILMGAGVIVLLSALFNTVAGWGWFESREVLAAPLDGADAIQLDLDHVDVHVVAEKRRDLELVVHGRGADGWLTLRRDGNVLHVERDSGWLRWGWLSRPYRLDIHVPQDYDQDMILRVDAGNITLQGTAASRPLSLQQLQMKVGSGNVDLSHLRIDQWQVDGSSGNVTAENVTAETARLEVTSGNIDVSGYKGDLRAKLTSGDLTAQVEALQGEIQADVLSGNITLDLPRQADFTLDARTKSGDISSDFSLEQAQVDQNQALAGTHGTGKHRLLLKTVSGDIRVLTRSR